MLVLEKEYISHVESHLYTHDITLLYDYILQYPDTVSWTTSMASSL